MDVTDGENIFMCPYANRPRFARPKKSLKVFFLEKQPKRGNTVICLLSKMLLKFGLFRESIRQLMDLGDDFILTRRLWQ